jgi:CRISPR/Cas system-associated exonuclease Cas4 (RecB family)
VTEQTAPALAAHRLTTRAYSLSALQRYAVCPYQFLLGSIYRLRPAEDLGPLQRLDPLTRGSLFHAVQADFYRRMRAAGELPVTDEGRGRALATLDRSIQRVAAEYHEQLAPAVERVWSDEIAAIRRDLRLWVDEIAREGGEWKPLWFEWAFGLGEGGPHGAGGTERDAASRPEPVVVEGRFPLRGSIDLVEQSSTTGALRVTDHKTGKFRGQDQMIVGGGAVLQPVLYGLAVEAALGQRVSEGRLFYCTSAGSFHPHRIPLTETTRAAGLEVLQVIDRAVEHGFLAAAPSEDACRWCDFRPVCGPHVFRRVSRKPQDRLADLLALRSRP